MYYPSLAEVEALAGQGNLVPVYREIAADLETPVSAYLKIARGSHSFLLESVEGGERLARYSFIGTEPYRVLRSGVPGDLASYRDPLGPIAQELRQHQLVRLPDLPRFHGGAVGYLAYEVVHYFERLPAPPADPLGLPEALFMFTDTLLVFDHLRHRIKVLSHVHLDGDVEAAYAEAVARIEELVARLRCPLALRPQGSALAPDSGVELAANLTQAEYEAKVERTKEYIRAGDIFQAILSLRLSRRTQADPFSLYRALRSINPSPYMFFLHLDDLHLIGSSIEPLVTVEDGLVETHTPAGTRPRGSTPEEDLALEEDLRADEKERAEHVMLVDLARNDLGRVSLPGTVRVAQFMRVDRYSHVMHLVSQVVGRLKLGLTCFDTLRACFPAGTVSGAPKIRAMEIIAELEPHRRGPYAGVVGYFSYSGNLDTAITIRTIVLKEGVAYVQAGAGIVADSLPEREYQECLNKAQALLRAMSEAEAGVELE